MTSPRALIPMADYGHDPTETAVAYTVFKDAGFAVEFATEKGNSPRCDNRMIAGISGKLLGANKDAITKYNQMLQDPAIQQPLSWSDPNFSLSSYDLVYFPGGHDKAVRQTIDSTSLQKHVAEYFPQTRKPGAKTVAAICHGVQTLAAAEKTEGKSVLHDVTTTALPGAMESGIFWLTRPFLGDYYKTYGKGTENVETIVRKQLDHPDQQYKNSLGPGPFVVEDEKYNYVSARFPPDTEALAKRAVELVKESTKS
ncbi:class I glutamine amidotransferase-like protein [Talaromyces proteolyticus]|uniref:Class I glutamine amidotransferase-like protein n=1 Tax=Talaromyces proteolyticus TaxID=1131652 RepID=A0AAD4KSM1_9EURO|nr:class I glutamine amidotransferase-like protein [Talaromyces proteolyticus]KAH8696150.1 class I glutamine amidotransferase-like protein [Talaromyces proteolyticus]